MAYWSIAVLIVSVSFIAYRHSSTASGSLPQWVRPGRRCREHGTQSEISTESYTEPLENGIANGFEVKINITEPSELEKTPKAIATEPEDAVPKLSLDGENSAEQKISPLPKPPPNSLRAVESHQRASSVPRSPNGTLTPAPRNPSTLMPPPPRPASVPPPISAASLRVPSTGPLPNRGPPANSQQRVGGSLSPNGAVTPPKARGKVLLAPGHSPMDWATLTRSNNLSGVVNFQRVTPSMLKSMTGRRGKPAWTSWQDKVYNITPYLPFHPGGEAELMKAAGRDGTQLFMEVHPWVNWENMLGSCLVGAMVPENYGAVDGASTLESID